MKKIPIYIVEEHHEAFYAWNYGIQNGELPPKDNILLHIDEHSDMGASTFNSSLHTLTDLKSMLDFTYNELHIANFILPTIYRGMINEIFWVKQDHQYNENKIINMYVRTYNNDGKKLLMGKKEELHYSGNAADILALESKIKYFTYLKIRLAQINLERDFILDIDLDFFSCTGDPNKLKEIYIEISENEFQSFINNPYHRLKFLGFKIVVKKIKELYYYVVNDYNAIYESSLNVSHELILTRVDELIDTLIKQKVKPFLITICRSRFSGFTPADKWEFIEEKLVERLSEIYDVNVLSINEIINYEND